MKKIFQVLFLFFIPLSIWGQPFSALPTKVPIKGQNVKILAGDSTNKAFRINYDDLIDTNIVFVSLFRQKNQSDAVTIQKAIDASSDGKTIVFESNKIYELNDGVSFIGKTNLVLNGNGATIKRADEAQNTATLSVAATSTSSTITVSAVPATWKINDQLYIITGNTSAEISGLKTIVSITGNSIVLSSAIGTINSISSFPIGTKVIKSYSLLFGNSSFTEVGIPQGSNKIIIKNLTFDGNKPASGQNTYAWNVNSAIFLHGLGSEICNCKFVNMPNEAIIGHGISIHDNVFQDNNGSCFHTSVNDATLTANSPSSFTNNVCRNTNIKTVEAGHSEGAVTFSWNGGRVNIVANHFYGGSGSVFGFIDGWTSGTANDKENYIISNNQCYNYAKIFKQISATAKNVLISNNIFSNCGDVTANNYETLNTSVQFCNNMLIDGTAATIAPYSLCSDSITSVLATGTEEKNILTTFYSWNGGNSGNYNTFSGSSTAQSINSHFTNLQLGASNSSANNPIVTLRASNSMLGIHNTTPTSFLHIKNKDTNNGANITLENVDATGLANAHIEFKNKDVNMYFGAGIGNNNLSLYSLGSTGTPYKWIVTKNGNMAFNGAINGSYIYNFVGNATFTGLNISTSDFSASLPTSYSSAVDFITVSKSNGFFSKATATDIVTSALAGSTAIGINTTPHVSARLDVSSTTGGILFPRMTTSQRDAINTAANGLVIYNTTTEKLQVRAAGAWVDLH